MIAQESFHLRDVFRRDRQIVVEAGDYFTASLRDRAILYPAFARPWIVQMDRRETFNVDRRGPRRAVLSDKNLVQARDDLRREAAQQMLERSRPRMRGN